jgi:methylglutaconyl-CoA hydratase
MNDHLQIVRAMSHAEVTLNRPACRNALSRALLADLTQTLQQLGQTETVRSVILTGASPAFCAGLDLREVESAADNDNSPLLNLLETIDRLPQPVIAAVNGPAVAGGATLVSACDLALCAQSASLAYPGVRLGLVAPLVMTYLCRLVGERRAKYLILTGNTISAAEAATFGLVNEIVPDAELLKRARQYADLVVSCPAAAVAETKRLFTRLRDLPAGADDARRLNAMLRRTSNAPRCR